MALVLSAPRGAKRTKNKEEWKQNVLKFQKNKVFEKLYKNLGNSKFRFTKM